LKSDGARRSLSEWEHRFGDGGTNFAPAMAAKDKKIATADIVAIGGFG